jgi:hypothetical protein
VLLTAFLAAFNASDRVSLYIRSGSSVAAAEVPFGATFLYFPFCLFLGRLLSPLLLFSLP